MRATTAPVSRSLISPFLERQSASSSRVSALPEAELNVMVAFSPKTSDPGIQLARRAKTEFKTVGITLGGFHTL